MCRSFVIIGLIAGCVIGLGVAALADIWGPILWSDNFEDGNYTSNPAWSVFGDPFAMASRSVTTWEGDYAFRLTAPYVDLLGAGWSGAYVDNTQGDQGIKVCVDTSPRAGQDWAAICLLRYEPTAGMGFGTGYAVVILHDISGAIVAQLFELTDDDYGEVTGLVVVSGTYSDVWVRFVALGTGTSTQLLARVWPVADTEPTTWTLDSRTTGGGGGITSYYDTGCGGVGVVALETGVTADAYFDDVEYVTAPLNAEPLP